MSENTAAWSEEQEQEYRNRLAEAVAQDYLGIQTLSVQGRDSLDFHDLSVGGIRAALLRMYELGIQRGKEHL